MSIIFRNLLRCKVRTLLAIFGIYYRAEDPHIVTLFKQGVEQSRLSDTAQFRK